MNSPFISLKETTAFTGLPRSTLIKHSKTGQFPPLIRLLGNRIAFVRADVQAWIDKRVNSTQEAA
ncbi:MAG: AlpA family phage regulatory protein [Pseudomonadales bacterium]|nr:AlpA family phage regulatory protein [Pseudomonadales bacterium]